MKWTVSLLIGLGIIVVGFRWLPVLLTIFFVMNCLVLIVVVLLQSGKAADLAGAFGGAGSQTAFGPRGAATVLSQATTWCAVMFMICALALVVRVDRSVDQGGSILQKFSKPASKQSTPARGRPQRHPRQRRSRRLHNPRRRHNQRQALRPSRSYWVSGARLARFAERG
jgi:preprotein translocase subunit SecG